MSASADLQWLLLRKSNSFIVKRAVDGPVFSKESGNLTNLHSYKYSGLLGKTLAVVPSSETAGVTLVKSSTSAKSTRKTTALKSASGPRRVAKVVAVETAAKGYRPDLRSAALKRASAILAAQKRTNNPEVKAKRTRSKKVAASVEA